MAEIIGSGFPRRNAGVSNGLLSGLVRHWPLTENAGGDRVDTEASKHLVENAANVPTVNDGLFGKAVQVSPEKYLSNTALVTLPAGDFSISIWMRHNQAPLSAASEYAGFNINPRVNMAVTPADVNNGLVIAGESGNLWVDFDGALPSINTWHLYVATYNNTTKSAKLYVDAVLQGTHTDAGFSFAGYADLETFIDAYNEGSGFHSDMTQAAVWTKVLDATMISALYNAGSGLARASWT